MSGWFEGTKEVIGGMAGNLQLALGLPSVALQVLYPIRLKRRQGNVQEIFELHCSVPIVCRRSLLVMSHVVLVMADNVPLEAVVSLSSPRSSSSSLSESAFSSCPSIMRLTAFTRISICRCIVVTFPCASVSRLSEISENYLSLDMTGWDLTRARSPQRTEGSHRDGSPCRIPVCCDPSILPLPFRSLGSRRIPILYRQTGSAEHSRG